MLIEEKMLTAFRGEDGLCRLKPERGGRYKYTDYPELLAELHESAKRPNLMRDGALKTVFTWNYFEELSDRVDHGIVAMLAFTNLVPVLPITRNWMAFQHQAAGHACRQTTFIGTVLEPKPEIKLAFIEIARANFYARGGWFEDAQTDQRLTDSYGATIHALGLSFGEQARAELCESIYPVDANTSSMSICFHDVGDLTYLTEDEHAKPLILFLSANSD
ncbi:hypothetical protein KX928_19865 [Roseobacter sp. YSTF-M11]|uniref:Uncharacterized protein n=1 Tax=Roseobacter insulae TaxID=2859783 RepID=A0A9X1G020_9RHOB|nr:hypothetical protein [Roseobacter insulae]MBW4710048.1 hypothetical protein [Roseobacter insulae]